MTQASNLRIDGARLWDTLMQAATYGGTPDGGVRRLALGPEDGAMRDRFRDWCHEAGLTTRFDAIGNIFARREGSEAGLDPVLLGSHLDSQPTGGKFDGALGVIAGLEIMRTLHDHKIRTRRPIELVNWTDEEGCRFGQGLIGSSVWGGALTAETAWNLADPAGISVGTALDQIGYRGPPAIRTAADAYFELHIEQGPVLEREAKQIGIVTGAQAQVWFDVVALGRDAHAGTTPPDARQDALVCAARIIDLVDRMMRARGEAGRGTVGQLTVLPNSRNTVPGEVRFSVEFRHPSDAEIDRLDAQFPREAGFIARDCAVKLSVQRVVRIAAQPFDPDCIALVRDAAAAIGAPARNMISGAGHDAIHVARSGVPTAMVFVPCRDGLSHNPAESITPEEAALGCQVLLEAVLARAGRTD
jgi:N-carbamoyl-L-amino-acid hydrolase